MKFLQYSPRVVFSSTIICLFCRWLKFDAYRLFLPLFAIRLFQLNFLPFYICDVTFSKKSLHVCQYIAKTKDGTEKFMISI